MLLAPPLLAVDAQGEVLFLLPLALSPTLSLSLAAYLPLLAVDAQGEVLFPLPLAHRLMASPACLPHLAQVGTLDPCVAATVQHVCVTSMHTALLACRTWLTRAAAHALRACSLPWPAACSAWELAHARHTCSPGLDLHSCLAWICPQVYPPQVALPPPAVCAAQVVLTGEPALVSAACALLLTVLRHNAGKALGRWCLLAKACNAPMTKAEGEHP